MKLGVCVVFLLLISSLHTLHCHLPSFTPETTQHRVKASLTPDTFNANRQRKFSGRLPGLCGRLKRRRITILCNLQTFCWRGWSHHAQAGQLCRCPRGSRCSRFFVHSL